jgi:hypothetical protein
VEVNTKTRDKKILEDQKALDEKRKKFSKKEKRLERTKEEKLKKIQTKINY